MFAPYALALAAYLLSSSTLALWARAVGMAALVVGLALAWRAPQRGRELQACTLISVAVLLLTLCMGHDMLANHHFVLTLLGLGVLLNKGHDAPAKEGAGTSAAWLLAALMGMAALQKLASPVYMHGEYFAYLLDTGGLGGSVLQNFEPWEQIFTDNFDAAQDFAMAEGSDLRQALRAAFDDTGTVATAFAWFVLFAELWLASVYAFARQHWIAPLSLMAFLAGLALMRAEWVFGTTVCALGFIALADQAWARWGLGFIGAGFFGMALLGAWV